MYGNGKYGNGNVWKWYGNACMEMVWKGKEIAISLKRSTMYLPSMVWKDKQIQISLTRNTVTLAKWTLIYVLLSRSVIQRITDVNGSHLVNDRLQLIMSK